MNQPSVPELFRLQARYCRILESPLYEHLLEEAAADSGRRLVLRELRGQPLDHPEIVTIPETGYIKGALLEALD